MRRLISFKTLLLAQGGFAAFLEADANARADLLEQLTGTDIYGRISQRVFERTREHKQALEQLQARAQGVDLLSDERRQQFQAELQAVVASESALSAQQQSLLAQRQWLQDCHKAGLASGRTTKATGTAGLGRCCATDAAIGRQRAGTTAGALPS